MKMLEAIKDRRSIRKFKDEAVSREDIERVLEAGILAPSSKNRQPWRFIVAEGGAKKEMLAAMDRGLAREKVRPLLPGSRQHVSGAEHTREIMEQASVVILIVNPLGAALSRVLTPEERVYEICNAQSVGAAIENMSLAAVELGLGSLWICDTYFAYEELHGWLGGQGELFAALALGYADECPAARPRRGLDEVIEWRKE